MNAVRVVRVQWRKERSIEPQQIVGTVDGFPIYVRERRDRLSVEIALPSDSANIWGRQALFEFRSPMQVWTRHLKPIVRDAIRVWALAFYG